MTGERCMRRSLPATDPDLSLPSAEPSGTLSASEVAAADLSAVDLRAEWRAVVAADPDALPEHAPEWVDAICQAGPYADATRLYVLADGRRFVTPLVRRTGPTGIGGWLLSPPPAWGMGGVVGRDLDATTLRRILADLRKSGAQRLWFRPDPMRADLWSAAAGDSSLAVPRHAHVVDLRGGAEMVWERMHRGARKYVRRAERAGVRIEIDRSGALLESYYDLYLASVDRWAGRQHEPLPLARWRARRRDPLDKLKIMADRLGAAFVLTMAYVDDEPAYGSIMLLGQTAHVTRSAMDIDRVGSTKAGSLVQWRMLQLACQQRCRTYHLGESGQSRDLAQFKESFGAVGIDYAEYRIERLPYTRVDQAARSVVKKMLRFRDV
jgi:Acetyltransferase (GNAT) domain